MKLKVHALLLFSALTLTAAQAAAQPRPQSKAQPKSTASSPCLLPGAPASCSKDLMLSLGSVYSEELTTNFPVNSPPTIPVYYSVRYSAPGCPYNSPSETDYFPVTVTYNNVTYTTAQYFIPTSSPQTLTVNLDLTNPTFPNCSSFPDCTQSIRVDINFILGTLCTSCNNDLGSLTYFITLKDHSVSGMDLRNGEVFYVGNDQHLHSQKWNAGWSYSPIAPANGGWGAVAAEGWVVASPSAGNVFFKSTGKMLYNIYKQGNSWFLDALSYSVNNVKGFIRLKGNRVYYVGVDCLVYYFEWNGSAWVHNVISPLTGWTNKLVKGAMDVSQVNDELFYRSQNGEVYRLYQNGGGQWDHELVLASGCASNILVDTQTNDVYFKATDSKVHRLRKLGVGVWQHTALSAVNVNYQAQGYLTKFPGEDRVFYIGADTLVHNVYLSGGSWYDFPLSYYVSPAVSDALAGEGKLFYFHGDNRIHNFYWAGTLWWDGPLVTSPANVRGCVTADHSPCATAGTGTKRR